jgi:hypothetical protein
LLAILAHEGGSWPEPDADLAIGADEGAFGGDAPDDIFGGQERRPGWYIVGHVLLMPAPHGDVKTWRREPVFAC